MAQFSYSAKLEIPAPKLTFKKTDTAKMKAAMKRAVTRGSQKGTYYVSASLKEALGAAVSSSTWQWNGKTTTRSNGSTASSPRDIVDTGRLKNSLKIKESFNQSGSKIGIAYSAPYAALVHYGGVVLPYGNKRANTVIIPARPWISATLQGTHGIKLFRWDKLYAKGINEAWTAQFG